MAYTESKFLYKIYSLDNTALTESAGNKYTWTPAKRWTVRGMVLVPTTAVGACSTAAVVLARWTPSGGSISSRLTATATASTGIGTEIAATESSTGYGTFDVDSGDTVIIRVNTAMSGGTTSGVVDVYLILSEKPSA